MPAVALSWPLVPVGSGHKAPGNQRVLRILAKQESQIDARSHFRKFLHTSEEAVPGSSRRVPEPVQDE